MQSRYGKYGVITTVRERTGLRRLAGLEVEVLDVAHVDVVVQMTVAAGARR